MHMSHSFSGALNVRESTLDFLWLELTNRCNLQCVHCYTESHPHSGDRDVLTTRDYEDLMIQAHALGCRKIQFIGGEPQLNTDFYSLLVRAKTVGFEFIEVFSNLTRLDEQTVRYAANNNISFATSVYSDDPDEHDAVTKVKSSHTRTIANIKKLIAAGIKTRAAIISVNQKKPTVDRTKAFLRDLGLEHISHGEVREFGRGEIILAQGARLSGLCGHCWAGKLCIAPDGEAYPCVMARRWSVGNVLETSLDDIVRARPLKDIRQEIFDQVWLPKIASHKSRLGVANSKSTARSHLCTPSPKCGPDTGAPDCAPELSSPQRENYPDKAPEPEPDEACPQSCNPDASTCEPMACPQSCSPNMVE